MLYIFRRQVHKSIRKAIVAKIYFISFCLIKNLDVRSLFYFQIRIVVQCKFAFAGKRLYTIFVRYARILRKFTLNINSPSPSVCCEALATGNEITFTRHKTQNTTYYYFYLPLSFWQWVWKFTIAAMIIKRIYICPPKNVEQANWAPFFLSIKLDKIVLFVPHSQSPSREFTFRLAIKQEHSPSKECNTTCSNKSMKIN